MHGRVAEDAVAFEDGVVEAGQPLAGRLLRAAVLIQRLSSQIWMASAFRFTPERGHP